MLGDPPRLMIHKGMTAQHSLAYPRPVKLTVDDFLLLDKAGAFDRYDKTELIDGVIVALQSEYRPHGYAKAELAYRIRRILETLGSPLYVSHETSVAMPPLSIPQPDIVLTAEPRGEGPIPLSSVALLIEVSVTTVVFDRGEKARIYAANGVPEYWVVDLSSRALHQMWIPGVTGYAEERSVALGEEVIAVTIEGLTVTTEGI